MPDTHDTPDESLLDGRYRLGDRLGSGGMADVYRAVDVLLGRDVAVKIIRPGTDGVSAPDRAHGEMSALASLNHPSLVTLLDAQLDTDAERQYLVMELVEGPTLSQELANGPLAPREVAQLASELAEALHVVHAAGVVHRDIKPSNVLLSPAHLPGHRFRAKLADFGIAYLMDRTRVTSPGDIIGTAAYLAPEQVGGSVPAPAADVYALGLVLIEALSGSPAFPHQVGVASALARLNAPPELPASASPEWRDLLERMTRIDASARPTALEVAVAASALAAPPADATGPAAAEPDAATVALAALGGAAGGAGVAAAGGAAAAAGAGGAAAAGVPASGDATEVIAMDGADPASAGGYPASAAGDPETEVFAVGGASDLPRESGPSTRVLPVIGDADPEPEASNTDPRRRRGVLIGAAAVGAAVVIGLGAWGIGTLGGGDEPASDDTVVTDPTPSAPATDDPADDEADEELVSDDGSNGGPREQPTPSEEPTEEPPAEEEPAEEAPAEEAPAEEAPPADPEPSTPVEPEPSTAPEEPAPAEPAPSAPVEPDPAPSEPVSGSDAP